MHGHVSLLGSMSGGGDHNGDGWPKHGRRPAVPDPRVRNQRTQSVYRGRTGGSGVDQECCEPRPRLRRHHCQPAPSTPPPPLLPPQPRPPHLHPPPPPPRTPPPPPRHPTPPHPP